MCVCECMKISAGASISRRIKIKALTEKWNLPSACVRETRKMAFHAYLWDSWFLSLGYCLTPLLLKQPLGKALRKYFNPANGYLRSNYSSTFVCEFFHYAYHNHIMKLKPRLCLIFLQIMLPFNLQSCCRWIFFKANFLVIKWNCKF